MRDLEVFRLVCVSRLTDFNKICDCQKEWHGESPNADQIWHYAVLIFGDIRPPKYV